MESSILDGDLRVGDFIVRPLLKTVRPADGSAGGGEQHLPDKAMAVLIYLAQRARQVCERDDILDAVWGTEREAYDRVLDNAIREIRRAFGDDARAPTYVQTIAKRGYRLLVHVESRLLRMEPHLVARSAQSEEDPKVQDEMSSVPAFEPRQPRIRLKTALAAVLLLALGAVIAWYAATTDASLSVDLDAGPGPEVLPAALLAELRHDLLKDHPCGEQSLLRPARFLNSPDFKVSLSARSSAGQTVLDATARINGTDHRLTQAGLSETQELASIDLTSFRLNLVSNLDHAVCTQDNLPPRRRACHCLAATRTLNWISEPSRHIQDLRRAIELDPGLIAAYEALAAAYEMKGDNKEQRDILEAGLSQVGDPGSVTALLLRRSLARAHQDFPTEYDLLDQLDHLGPENPTWRAAKASFRVLHSRQCDAVATDLIPYLESDSAYQSALIDGVGELWSCRQEDAALRILEERIRRSPRDTRARHQTSVALMLKGRYEEANQAAHELLALSPGSEGTYWLLGTIAMHRGELAAADKWFRQMEAHLRWPIDRSRFYNSLARVALLRGDGSDCPDFSEVESDELETEGHGPEQVAHWTSGLCLLETGDLQGARRMLDHMQSLQIARSTRWKDEYVLHLESRIVAASKDDPEAKQHAGQLMQRALANKPIEFVYFATEAAVAQEQAGHPDQARMYYQEALTANPNYPWASCHLGLLELKEGRTEEARHHLRHALEVFGDAPETPLGRRCAGALQTLESSASGETAHHG